MRVIDINLPNLLIIGLAMILWRFLATLLAARFPDSKVATSLGLVAG